MGLWHFGGSGDAATASMLTLLKSLSPQLVICLNKVRTKTCTKWSYTRNSLGACQRSKKSAPVKFRHSIKEDQECEKAQCKIATMPLARIHCLRTESHPVINLLKIHYGGLCD